MLRTLGWDRLFLRAARSAALKNNKPEFERVVLYLYLFSTVLMQGIKLIKVPKHQDSRGCLIAFDQNQFTLFSLNRIYCIFDCPEFTARAGHAVSAHTALIVLNSSVNIDLDNGSKQLTLQLSNPQQALCIHAGIWLRLSHFTADTILLALASQTYAKTTYFDCPQPNLLKNEEDIVWR